MNTPATVDRANAAISVHADSEALLYGQHSQDVEQPNILVSPLHGGVFSGSKGGEFARLVTQSGANAPVSETLPETWDRLLNIDTSDAAHKLVAGMAFEMSVAVTSSGNKIPVGSLRVTTALAPSPITSMPLIDPPKRIQPALRVPGAALKSLAKELGVGALSAAQMATIDFVQSTNAVVTLTGLTDIQERSIKSRYTGVTESFVFADQRNTHIHRLASVPTGDDALPPIHIGVSAQDVAKGKPAVVIVPFDFPAQTPLDHGGQIKDGQLVPSPDGYNYAHEWGSVAAQAALDVASVISAESITYANPKGVSPSFAKGFTESIAKGSSALKRETNTTPEYSITRMHVDMPRQRDRMLSMQVENMEALEPSLVQPLAPFRSRLQETIQSYMTAHAPANVLRQMLNGWVKAGRVHQDEVEQSGLYDALRIVGTQRVSKEGVLTLMDSLQREPQITYLTGDQLRYAQPEYGSQTVDAYREILIQHAAISPKDFAQALYGGDDGLSIQKDQSGSLNAVAQTVLSPALASQSMPSSMPDSLVKAMARTQWLPKAIAAQDIPLSSGRKSLLVDQGDIHFPEHDSLVAHLRAGLRYSSDGKAAYHILEAQSDWAKMLRQFGSTDDLDQLKEKYTEAKGIEQQYFTELVKKLPIHNLREKWLPARAQRTMIDALYQYLNHGSDDAANTPQLTRQPTQPEKDLLQAWHDANLQKLEAGAEYDNALKYGMPKGPWVRNDSAWGKLAMAVALREAVLVGASQLSWDSGDVVNRRFNLPADAGLNGLYDRTLPNCAKKLIRQHDASSQVEKIGDVWRFEITPELAKSVSNGMYAYHQMQSRWRNAPTTEEAAQGHARVLEGEIAYLFGSTAQEALKITVLPRIEHHPNHHNLPVDTVGFFDDVTRQTYLIADRIAPSFLRPLVLHEIGVHHGLSMLGDKGQRILNEVTDMLQANDMSAIAIAKDVPHVGDQQRYSEELLALMAMQPPSSASHPADHAKSCIRAFLVERANDLSLQPHDIPYVAEGWLHRVRQHNSSPTISTSRQQIMTMLAKHQNNTQSITYKIVDRDVSETPSASARKVASLASISHSRILLGDFTISEQSPQVKAALLRAGAVTQDQIDSGVTGIQVYEDLRRKTAKQLKSSSQHLATPMTNELLAEVGISGMSHGEVGEVVVFDTTPDTVEPYLPFSNAQNTAIRAITLAAGEGSGLSWTKDGVLHDGETQILRMQVSNGDLYISEINQHPLTNNAIRTIIDASLRYAPLTTLAIETGDDESLRDYLTSQKKFHLFGTELQLPLKFATTGKDFDTEKYLSSDAVVTTATRFAQREGDAIFVSDAPLAIANLSRYETENGSHQRLAGLQATTPLLIPIDCGEYVAVTRRLCPETGATGWAAARCDNQGEVVAEYIHSNYDDFQRFMSVLTNRSQSQQFSVELHNEHGEPTPEGQFLTHNLVNWISEHIEIDAGVVDLISQSQRDNDIATTHAYLKAIAPNLYDDAMHLMGVTIKAAGAEPKASPVYASFHPG